MEPFLDDPRHIQLVDWLVTPPHEREAQGMATTLNALAEQFGVHPRTVRGWKERDDVRRAWKKHSDRVVGDPSKVQEVLEELRKIALDRESSKQVQAAKLYLEAVEAVKPPDRSVELKMTPDELAKWSDEQLDARIAEAIAMQRAHEVLNS